MDTNIANRQLLTTPAARGLHRTVLALAALAMAGAMAGFAPGAQANSFTDGGFGSFSGSTGACSPTNNTQQVTNSSGDLPDWTVNSNYTFVLNTTNYGNFANVYGNNGCIGLQAPVGSQPGLTPPVGPNFLGIDPAYQNNTNNSANPWSIAQALTGLVVGATYNVTFDMAAGQQKNFVGSTTDTWLVGLGAGTNINSVAGTGTPASQGPIALPDLCGGSNPCGGGFSGWAAAEVSLVATSVNEVLWFFAESTSNSNQPPFLLLDGVTMTQQTTVPEPSTYGVLLVGLLALLGVRRVYRNKKA